MHTYDLVKGLKRRTFLLNTIWNDEQLARFLPNQLKRYLAENEIQFYTINAVKLASEVGLGGRINTAMETAFFKLAEIMPFEQVLPILKDEALKSYGHKSMKVVEKIFKQSIRPLNCCIRYLFQQSGERLKFNRENVQKMLVILFMKLLNRLIVKKGMRYLLRH